MEGSLNLSLHKGPQFIETVVDAPFMPGPVQVLTSTPSNALQERRKQLSKDNSEHVSDGMHKSAAVDKADNVGMYRCYSTPLNGSHQLPTQHQLYSIREIDPRREQLKGKKILFVCCGHDGLDSKKFAFELVKELGVLSFLVEDGQNTLARTMEKSKIIEQLINVDMTPRASLLEDVVEAIQSVSTQIGGFDAVCTLWDDAVCLCARLAERLSLPGSSTRSIDIAHDKHLTRKAMLEAGLPTPANYLVKCERDLAVAAEIVGVPAILKPMYGGSSLGVIKVEELENLKETYHRVIHMLKQFYDEGELMGLTFNESELGPTFEQSSISWLVMEEFLDGEEVDVDLLLKDGQAIYQCVVDDWPQIQPWFAEMGNTCPSALPSSVQQELITMAYDTATKAMGFRDGIFHCELKNTRRGPRIIEVNPRMGGGPVWLLHKLAFGLDFVEETLYSALRIPGLPPVSKSPKRYVACSEKFFEHSMAVPKEFPRVVEAMRFFPNIIEATALVEPGEKIVGIRDGFPTRTARFIAYGDSPADVEFYAQKLLDMCDIPQVRKAQRAYDSSNKS